MDYYTPTVNPPRLRTHATLSHCTVAPLPQISLHASFLSCCRHTFDASSTLPAPLAPLVVLVERSSQPRVMLKYHSYALLQKRVIAVSPQLSASLCNILPFGLCYQRCLDSGHARIRDKSGMPQCNCANPHRLHLPCSIAYSLDLLSQLSRLQSRPRHIQNPNIISVLFMSLSVFFSYAGDLVVERLVSTYPILPLPPYSYQYLLPLSPS